MDKGWLPVDHLQPGFQIPKPLFHTNQGIQRLLLPTGSRLPPFRPGTKGSQLRRWKAFATRRVHESTGLVSPKFRNTCLGLAPCAKLVSFGPVVETLPYCHWEKEQQRLASRGQRMLVLQREALQMAWFILASIQNLRGHEGFPSAHHTQSLLPRWACTIIKVTPQVVGAREANPVSGFEYPHNQSK